MPREGGRRSRRFWRRTLFGLLASFLFALIAAAVTYAWDRQRRVRAQATRNADIASSLRTGLATPVESLYAVQAFLAVRRGAPLTLARFRDFCAPAVRRRPEIAALEWFPLVEGESRADFELLVGRDQPGFEIREPTRAGPMVRAVPRPAHVPLTFMEPPVDEVRGLDLAFDPERIAPVHRAFENGRATLSDRFQLVEDPPGVLSVAAYAPVTHAVWMDPAAAGGRTFSRGVAVALFRLSPLIQSALKTRDLGGLDVELWDPHAPEASRLLYRSGDPAPSADRDEAEVPFVDRTYRLVVYSNGARVGFAPLFAFVLTLLGSVGVMALLDARRRARRLALAAARLGQYQLEARIASGGMGTVYRAHHALLRRPTAIKIAHEEQAAAAFEKEVLVTSTLTHPNTVVVYDFGRGETESTASRSRSTSRSVATSTRSMVRPRPRDGKLGRPTSGYSRSTESPFTWGATTADRSVAVELWRD
jgi:CHASE1-domain containing sensor protein